MKTLKKLLAMLLALAMVLCFVACDSEGGGDDDEEGGSSKKRDGIKGEWTCKLDMLDALNENMPEGVNIKGHLYVNLKLEFEASEFTLSMSPDKDSIDDFIDNYIDAMYDYTKKMLEDSGSSVSDWEEGNNTTLREYCKERAEESVEDMTSSMTNEKSGFYKLEDGKILIAQEEEDLEDTDSYMEYELDGNQLKVTNMVNNGDEAPEIFAETFPWVFE